MTANDCTTPATFARIAVKDIIDFLCDAYDAAVAALASYDGDDRARWTRALDKAWGFLLTSDTLEFDAATGTLKVPSASTAGRTYLANGRCGCTAYRNGDPCQHRAAAKLTVNAVRRQQELADLAAEIEAETGRDGMALARQSLDELSALASAFDRSAYRPANWVIDAEDERRALTAELLADGASVSDVDGLVQEMLGPLFDLARRYDVASEAGRRQFAPAWAA